MSRKIQRQKTRKESMMAAWMAIWGSWSQLTRFPSSRGLMKSFSRSDREMICRGGSENTCGNGTRLRLRQERPSLSLFRVKED